MNENPSPNPSPSGSANHAAPQPLGSQRNRGSLWMGFGLFWGISFFAYPPLMALGIMMSAKLPITLHMVRWFGVVGLPLLFPVFLLVLCVWLAMRGWKRTALGMVLGFASLVALMLIPLGIRLLRLKGY